MPRVFVDEPLVPGGTYRLRGSDGHHYARVLRVQRGEAVAVSGLNGPFLGEVTAVDPRQGEVLLHIQAPLPRHEPQHAVWLVQGLAKGDKIEAVIQHGTELGAAGFLVYAAARSVVRLDAQRAAEKCARWQRIAREAAGQAQRDCVPTVAWVPDWPALQAWLAKLGSQRVAWLDEAEQAFSLRKCLAAWDAAGLPAPTVLGVGPEGGWTHAERDAWQALGARGVTLGPRTLRTETAGWAALSAVLFHYGELGG
ncbi:MAG: 16S rRNA (uracil(1498)-N(3))-methyltransferase [Alicyclobacillus sp.]|nr:16S rRNA (uracil(1498)-N(3))-methyltransferase [Alicyclobacillus sp.]